MFIRGSKITEAFPLMLLTGVQAFLTSSPVTGPSDDVRHMTLNKPLVDLGPSSTCHSGLPATRPLARNKLPDVCMWLSQLGASVLTMVMKFSPGFVQPRGALRVSLGR